MNSDVLEYAPMAHRNTKIALGYYWVQTIGYIMYKSCRQLQNIWVFVFFPPVSTLSPCVVSLKGLMEGVSKDLVPQGVEPVGSPHHLYMQQSHLSGYPSHSCLLWSCEKTKFQRSIQKLKHFQTVDNANFKLVTSNFKFSGPLHSRERVKKTFGKQFATITNDVDYFWITVSCHSILYVPCLNILWDNTPSQVIITVITSGVVKEISSWWEDMTRDDGCSLIDTKYTTKI